MRSVDSAAENLGYWSAAFVAELPLNGPGKIDRKVLQRVMRERYGALG
jgi:hypothetical protein